MLKVHFKNGQNLLITDKKPSDDLVELLKESMKSSSTYIQLYGSEADFVIKASEVLYFEYDK